MSRARSSSTKIALSLAALGLAGAIACLGTFATFTSTTSATQTATGGKVAISLGVSGAANRLSVDATDIVPGDTISRAVDLISTSSAALKSVTLITTPTVSSVLNTDTADGLKMYIRNCSVAWTETGTSPAYTYNTCSGTTSAVLASSGSPTPVTTTTSGGVSLTGLAAITSAGTVTDHLVITVLLPTSNTSANLTTPPTSTIQFSFTGTQRDGTPR